MTDPGYILNELIDSKLVTMSTITELTAKKLNRSASSDQSIPSRSASASKPNSLQKPNNEPKRMWSDESDRQARAKSPSIFDQTFKRDNRMLQIPRVSARAKAEIDMVAAPAEKKERAEQHQIYRKEPSCFIYSEYPRCLT